MLLKRVIFFFWHFIRCIEPPEMVENKKAREIQSFKGLCVTMNCIKEVPLSVKKSVLMPGSLKFEMLF